LSHTLTSASESKREQFRRYLEKAGVLDSLTNVLVALYEETEKPSNALEYPYTALNTLQQKYDQLTEENKELRSRLLQYEPAQDAGTE
uniref:MYC binding protein n=1 Tax=Sinocyclocheilus grahami TaxID=75366 RepID=A0A672KBM7_SINGR